MPPATRIVFPLYPGVTHLDFTGPHQIFSRLPGASVQAASLSGADVEGDGLVFTGLARLEEIEACDVICVPGGFGCTAAMNDDAFMGAIRRLAASATYITSVCTGSLILGAAGLIKGRRAACHWAWRDLLPLFGAIPDAARVVRDGDIITGGGVTAGLDFALTLVAELQGEQTAQAIQLALEYAPSPPFGAGRPESAPPLVLARVQAMQAPAAAGRRLAAEQAAARL